MLIRQDATHALYLANSADAPIKTLVSRLAASGYEDSSWPPDGIVLSDTIHVLARDMVSDGASGAYVLVTLQPQCPPFTSCPAELRLHHVLSTGELDPLWPPSGVLVSDAPALDLSGRLAEDRAGGAYVVWYQMSGDPELGDSLRVWAQHVDVTGLPHTGWPNEGKQLMYADDTLQEIADIDVLSTGDLLVLVRVAGFRPVLGCWTSTGSLREGWPALGKTLIGPQQFGYDSRAHQLLVTAADQIVAVWAERVTLGINAIAGIALGAEGEILPTWPAAGVRFCENSNSLQAPVVVEGSSGTFVLAWEESPEVGADLGFDRYYTVDGAVPTRWSGRFAMPRVSGRRVEALCHFDSPPQGELLVHRSLDSGPFLPVSAPLVEGTRALRIVDEIPDPARLARYFLANSAGTVTDTLTVSLLTPREPLLVRAPSPQSGRHLSILVPNPSGEVRAELFDVAGRLRSVVRASPSPSGVTSPVELRFSAQRSGLYWVRVHDAAGRVGLTRVVAMQ